MKICPNCQNNISALQMIKSAFYPYNYKLEIRCNYCNKKLRPKHWYLFFFFFITSFCIFIAAFDFISQNSIFLPRILVTASLVIVIALPIIPSFDKYIIIEYH